MKLKDLLFALLTFVIFITACSKTSNTNPKLTPVNQVTINGKIYSTVVIGTQTWTSVNYDGPGGIGYLKEPEDVYGKFYTLEEVNGVVLPQGWRVPTQNDFVNLLMSQGSTAQNNDGTIVLDTTAAAHLRSKTYWTLPGDNASGFNAQPAGDYNYYLKEFENIYAYATFWSTTSETYGLNPTTQTVLVLVGYREFGGVLYNHEVAAYTLNETPGELAYNLRFVKDN